MKRSHVYRVILPLLLVFSMMLSACGGNSDKESNASNAGNSSTPSSSAAPSEQASPSAANDVTSKEVKLKMVLLGAQPNDFKLVLDEINKKLKEKINATLEVQFLDWSDWTQKYPLMFSANEDFDLVYTANWANYSDQALKGGFKELTEDMLRTYAPKTYESISKDFWDQTKVRGKIYMVPNNIEDVTDKVVLVRGDLLKKYNLPSIQSPDDFAKYLITLADKEKGLIPYNIAAGNGAFFHDLDQLLVEQNNEWNLVDNGVPLAYKMTDNKGKIFNFFETPEYKQTLSLYKTLSEKGAWPKNVVNNKSDTGEEFKVGKNAVAVHNTGTLAGLMSELARPDKHPEYDTQMFDLSAGKKKIAAIATQNGTAIHATSKNPERALMLIDLLENDKEIHDLIMYGIANKHYVPVGEDKMSPGPDAANYGGFSNWGWYSKLDRVDSTRVQAAQDMIDQLKTEVYHFPLETFVFDDSKVKNEKANVGNVLLRYGLPLEYGLVKDTDKGLQDLIAQLKKAGIEKIQSEMQKQIDAFLASRQ